MNFDSAEIGDPMNPREQKKVRDTKSANLHTFKPRKGPLAKIASEPGIQRRKIALLGSASSSANLAPWDDQSWEIWNLAWRVHDAKRNDLLFEIHHREQWKYNQGGTDEVLAAYTKFLQNNKTVPIYLLKPQPDIPSGIEYPMAEVIEAIGRKYFASSIGFMLGLIILQIKKGRPIDEVGLWGIDLLCEDEFAEQRPNAEFLLGVLQGLGVKLYIPDTSALLKCNHTYGEEDAPGNSGINAFWLTRRISEYEQNHARMLQGLHSYDGAYQAADLFATDPEKAPPTEKPGLEKLAMSEEQRAIAAQRARIFLEKKEEHRLALCKIDGALEATRYYKAMAEHHQRNGVIPG